ncbi:LLM class flavin-dependent oxidoreductase [Kribbella sandramycini]|uniref:Alkanesulfonate monooxygenase SsuD/methylene tetrahydromethanopterin reductase-like flavin-dependent oxidoreductase (Luciferase family) n=1 Tax=Kribbella sandramycini TaxID=60450 RepID=A0A7Y4KVX4_9ACTN|nr:LLM class flavin-dependent oxidoreductase [Kribbella sandramycini]MBB6567752.1 alkanesulfonate monooxygenase SsuD/methylene tetrahydromethanopterin reductase-like flavin-dependent oxidoreductase (luciferase family) [Kribbella sandramycini]NOL39652.1 LLM class flavin-dependent oxidoreductase [Kribbella sandramycini]
MTDYGHDLIFGSFVTPVSTPVQRPVELSVVSERAGLDVVSFQDHPYMPALQDTWTLLSYVAARTERIRFTGNVLNLPLRPPAVLARAAAGLDQLSGGRFEMGIGAGGFWDAIGAMGGQRLDPGDSVLALEEGIQIMRGLWDTSQPGGFSFDGEFYQVPNAKRGPAPAHAIPVRVGSYKPRMLRLTGRVGDGWLPTLKYLPEGITSLAWMNEHIDEGALAVGRKPTDVTRYLNIDGRFSQAAGGLFDGPPQQWAEQIADVALAYGISGFLLMSDDPADLELFGREVAPLTRELVAAERD